MMTSKPPTKFSAEIDKQQEAYQKLLKAATDGDHKVTYLITQLYY